MQNDKILKNSETIQRISDFLFSRSKYLVIATSGYNIGHLIQELIIASSICKRDNKVLVIIPQMQQCNSEIIKCNIEDVKIIRKGIKVLILKLILNFSSILIKLRNFFFSIIRKTLRNNSEILSHRQDTVCIGFEKNKNSFRKIIGSNFYWDYDLMKEKPQFNLNNYQKSLIEFKMKNIGIKEWYVCLHIRESNYTGASETRDVSIKNYIPMITYINSLGGKVIKMGDKGMKEVSNIEGLIDYANSENKDELMDLILINNCRLFVGCSSGLVMLAYLLNKDVINLNFNEFAGAFFGNSKATVLKNIFLKSRSKVISPKELILSNYYKDFLYNNSDNIILNENTSDQILTIIKKYFNQQNLFDIEFNKNFEKDRKFVHEKILKDKMITDMMSDYLEGTLNSKTNLVN